ncbi:aspartoacylase [Catenovulum agarivorans DS-2]|uniref:Aspartoacylase n=1 Tax=Catenovulum agarivorans DS-2 TaxID=1328313 RepID=W7QWQ2_9ALTE|nr:aspartoacylase [Catenovulum agarivorans]EWH12173.1 aspartoacylase [Catenovulum agarivorans DS-2]
MSIKNVAVVCGTHGNEITGVYLMKKWQKAFEQISRASFSTKLLQGNPKAYEINRRYVDRDLNRQFASKDLENPELSHYEALRAKSINQILGPKGKSKTDLVIDLHTTTSNMGPTLLMPQKGPFYSRLAAYVKSKMPEVVVFCDEDHKKNEEHHLLCTVGKYGVIVEVGPVPQSVLRHDVFEQSEQLTQHILDFVELFNTDALPKLPSSIEAFRFVKSLKLPLDADGERIGMVHKNIQDGDFKPVKPGEPIFQLFDGGTVSLDGDETLYTAFVNEAAYYDNNLATSLMRKICLEVE